VTNWAGLYDGWYGQPYALQFTQTTPETWLSRLFSGSRRGMRKDKALITALLGAAAGGTAASTYKRVDASNDALVLDSMGGQRSVETVTDINRATTSADVTNLLALMNLFSEVTTPPTNLNGLSLYGNPGGFI
jgi:hypothetical protein